MPSAQASEEPPEVDQTEAIGQPEAAMPDCPDEGEVAQVLGNADLAQNTEQASEKLPHVETEDTGHVSVEKENAAPAQNSEQASEKPTQVEAEDTGHVSVAKENAAPAQETGDALEKSLQVEAEESTAQPEAQLEKTPDEGKDNGPDTGPVAIAEVSQKATNAKEDQPETGENDGHMTLDHGHQLVHDSNVDGKPIIQMFNYKFKSIIDSSLR